MIGRECWRQGGISTAIPTSALRSIHNAMRHYYFNILTTTFNFGGIPHEEIKKSMRLFAKEVMPAFR